MCKCIWVFIVVGAVGLGGAFLSGAALEDDQEVVKLEDVPRAVRATFEREAGDGIILVVYQEREGRRMVFEAEILVDADQILEVEVAADGTVLEREMRGVDEEDDEDEDDDGDDDEGEDDDEEAGRIPLGDVPAPALQTIRDHARGHAFQVTSEREHGATIYEARWQAGGSWTEIAVTAEGALLEIEEIVSERAVPEAVLQAVEERFRGADEIVYAKKTLVLYEVEAVVDGREREVLVLPTGKTLDGHD